MSSRNKFSLSPRNPSPALQKLSSILLASTVSPSFLRNRAAFLATARISTPRSIANCRASPLLRVSLHPAFLPLAPLLNSRAKASQIVPPMEDEITVRIAKARTASGGALRALLHDPAEEVLVAALANPALTESDVCVLLERLDLSPALLGAVAAHPSWTKNEGVRLRLARHPRTPHRVALALLRQLFLFDLVQVSLLPSAPAEIRRVSEEL